MTLSDAEHELSHCLASAIAATLGDIPLADVKLHALEGPGVCFEVADASKAKIDWLHALAAVGPLGIEPEPKMRKALTDMRISNAACLSENDRAAIARGNASHKELTTVVMSTFFHGVSAKAAAAYMQLAKLDADPVPLDALFDEKRLRSALKTAEKNEYALALRKAFDREKTNA